ncbi:tetratricopeptide repeat protein [Flavobacterium covae]|nr:tetratricopeptide repeat protein [Flavobacterium covae]
MENELQKNTHNTSSLRENYFKLAGKYYNLGDSENYLRVSRIAFQLSKEAKDSENTAKGYHYIGDYFYSKFKNDSAYYYYTKSEKNYELLKKTKELARIKFSKADILLYEKDFSGAEVEFIKVLKIAKILNDTRLIYDCYLDLGNVLLGLNSPDEAIIYYNKALSIITQLTKDPQYQTLKAQIYNFLGKAYTKKKAYHEAIAQYEEGLLFTNPEKIGSYIYSSLISNKAYAEMQLDNLEIAEEKLYESLAIRKKENNIPGIVLSNIYLGELYLYKKDISKAIYFLRNAKQIASKNKILEDELRSLRLLSKIDKKNQYDLYEEYINLNDSIQTVEFNKRNSFARIEYETDEILTEKGSFKKKKIKFHLKDGLFYLVVPV